MMIWEEGYFQVVEYYVDKKMSSSSYVFILSASDSNESLQWAMCIAWFALPLLISTPDLNWQFCTSTLSVKFHKKNCSFALKKLQKKLGRDCFCVQKRTNQLLSWQSSLTLYVTGAISTFNNPCVSTCSEAKGGINSKCRYGQTRLLHNVYVGNFAHLISYQSAWWKWWGMLRREIPWLPWLCKISPQLFYWVCNIIWKSVYRWLP